ncbi:uncharacterized protein (DUF885 family) [Haloactinopolyspora alba]|uniref:Uncharacterized protein (DUF885 family) n=1 Tax=Haloactinopolyspora alba TaxID=648780 RepID=A0A2P8E144_9ACTN|nr:DUF885 domain-containing protein [Haloactinopolyspora alba]PSL03175.1 uncharacterized protein (DUF885 family) [Haloactinopolyspora alba]
MTTPQNTTAAAATAPTVDEIADAYVDDYAALDPYIATYIGVDGHDAEATDLSPDGFAERRALAERTLRALDGATARDHREQVAADAMRERLGLDLEMHDAGLNRALNVIESPMHWVREVFDLMPTDTADQWANIATRLRTVPTALEQYRRTIRADTDSGHAPAVRQVVAVSEQCRRLADGFFAEFAASGPETMRGELDAGAAGAATAFADFGRFLTDEIAPRSGEHDAVGRDVYSVASRSFLGAEVDLDETYEWGVDELARIEAEMADVAQRIVPGGSVDDAVAALDAEPGRAIAGTTALQAWMQELSDRTLEALGGVHFDIPEPLRRLECHIAPTREGGVYYTPPSDDFSRPGRMWWSVPEGVDDFTTWRETTTVFHEGVPGHHLQVGQALHRRDQLNRWQRLLSWVSGHGEGWALYAERLMADLGFLDDPGDRLGMLDGQRFRAARVVVDIGVHLGKDVPDSLVRADGLAPGRWTPDSAFTFLRTHCRMPDESLRFELDRYLGWPGQAPSYKVGERIWLAAREDARRRQGDSFDLKEFHRAALDLGSLGLDPLRTALARL